MKTVATKSRRAIVSVWRTQAAGAAHAACSPHAPSSRLADDADERLVQAGPRDREPGDAVPGVDQPARAAARSRSVGQLKRQPSPSATASAGSSAAIAGVGAVRRVVDAARQRRARVVDGALEAALPAGDDRQPVAQPLGMRHDVGREQDGRAAVALGEDQRLQPLLVDRVEAGERLVEDEQVGLVDDRAEQLDELRHALRQLADLARRRRGRGPPSSSSRRARAGARVRHGRPRSAPRKAIASRAFIDGIEPALLGQVADAVAGVARVAVRRAGCASPSSGSMMPSSMRSVVVLPAPLGPSTP